MILDVLSISLDVLSIYLGTYRTEQGSSVHIYELKLQFLIFIRIDVQDQYKKY